MKDLTKNGFSITCVIFALFFLWLFFFTTSIIPFTSIDADIAVRLRSISYVIVGIFWLLLALLIKSW